ncbi:hypothetical protein ACGFX4_33615 [Kitasatospora sp. NPDC048365]|uniref:hypothetical protein n=1 Tax=Kitasatospora sp. NPDC048365 TaxID=3364050 RepID=UPI003721E3C2
MRIDPRRVRHVEIRKFERLRHWYRPIVESTTSLPPRACTVRPPPTRLPHGETTPSSDTRGARAPPRRPCVATPGAEQVERTAALKPLLADLDAGRLTSLTTAHSPYPWWLRGPGIALFSIGFAPPMQATWYEVRTTAVRAAVSAALAIAAAPVLGAVATAPARRRLTECAGPA